MYIAIQLIANCMAYRLPGLLNEYVEFSGVNALRALFEPYLKNNYFREKFLCSSHLCDTKDCDSLL